MNEKAHERTGTGSDAAWRAASARGRSTCRCCEGVNLSVRAGERLAIIGASGSGKTTLLQILGGLDRPTAGTVQIAGSDIHALDGEAARRAAQPHARLHLPVPSPAAGVLGAGKRGHAAAGAARAASRSRAARARDPASAWGSAQRLVHRPHELSGGERQRAAVARALVTNPRIVLADEPTGNLDGGNAESVFALMLELNRELGTSLIVVTHDRRLAARMDRILELERGNLVERT